MPRPGHRPITNTDLRNESAVFETASNGGVVRNRVSLSYYQPPGRKMEIREAAVMLEGAEIAPPPAPLEVFPDAAVASLGDHTLLEAIIGIDDRVKVAEALLQTNPWRQICAL